jgi:hypothetical protein
LTALNGACAILPKVKPGRRGFRGKGGDKLQIPTSKLQRMYHRKNGAFLGVKWGNFEGLILSFELIKALWDKGFWHLADTNKRKKRGYPPGGVEKAIFTYI